MKRALTTLVALFALSACGSQDSNTTEETPAAEQPAAAQPAEEAAEPAAAEAAPAGGGGASVCERARECCNAYVQAMGAGVTADQACSGIDAAAQTGGATADASCTAMINGWRQGLTALSREVPAACQ